MNNPNVTNPDVVERLTRMETKLDLTLVGLNDVTKDHETRIRAVESQMASTSAIGRWKATTGLALIVALIGLTPWIISLIK